MRNRNKPWQPLLSGAEARRAREIVSAILTEAVQDIPALCEARGDASVVDGTAGLALLAAYARRLDIGLVDRESLWSFARHAIVDGRREHGASLFFGAVGAAWLDEHIALDVGYRHIDQSGREICQVVDDSIANGVQLIADWRYRFDLMRGLAGVSVYLMERTHTTGTSELVEQVIQRLVAAADCVEGGQLGWHRDVSEASSPEAIRYVEDYHHITVPRGATGPMGALARASKLSPRYADLCAAALQWILNQRDRGEKNPNIVVRDGGRYRPWAQPSWAFGDLGIAASVAAAATLLDRPEWLTLAKSIASTVTTTSGRGADGDNSIYHGAAGNAHLFARLYQATSDTAFRDVAVRWYKIVLMRGGRAGEIGQKYGTFVGDSGGRWGLMRGAAGVGLALLAGISEEPPGWDRLLLAALE